MRAGRLDTPLVIKRPKRTGDGEGGRKVKPEVLRETWGDVEELSGSELVRYRQVSSEVTTRITVREQDGLDASCVVFAGEDEYRVDAVVRNHRERQMEILAVRVETKRGR